MPSALETLVKILKLEREQGFKNTAVIGGLTDFSEKWSVDAHKQARKPEHHALADELVATLRAYDAANDAERQRSVAVMLDRILNRVQPQRSPPPQNAEAGAEGGEPQNRPPRTERRERQPRPPQAQQSQPPEGDQAQPPQEPPRQSNREAQANQGQRRDTQGGQNNQNRDNQNRNNRGRSQGQGGEQQRRPQPMAAQREGGGDSFEGGYEGGYDFEFYAGKSPAPQRIDIPARPTLARPPRKARKPVNLEEASELVEAKDSEHVANEFADLLYFALVKAAKHGVTLAQVSRGRSRHMCELVRLHAASRAMVSCCFGMARRGLMRYDARGGRAEDRTPHAVCCQFNGQNL